MAMNLCSSEPCSHVSCYLKIHHWPWGSQCRSSTYVCIWQTAWWWYSEVVYNTCNLPNGDRAPVLYLTVQTGTQKPQLFPSLLPVSAMATSSRQEIGLPFFPPESWGKWRLECWTIRSLSQRNGRLFIGCMIANDRKLFTSITKPVSFLDNLQAMGIHI